MALRVTATLPTLKNFRAGRRQRTAHHVSTETMACLPLPGASVATQMTPFEFGARASLHSAAVWWKGMIRRRAPPTLLQTLLPRLTNRDRCGIPVPHLYGGEWLRRIPASLRPEGSCALQSVTEIRKPRFDFRNGGELGRIRVPCYLATRAWCRANGIVIVEAR